VKGAACWVTDPKLLVKNVLGMVFHQRVEQGLGGFCCGGEIRRRCGVIIYLDSGEVIAPPEGNYHRATDKYNHA